MKYVVKYYHKYNGTWHLSVKVTTDFELFINYLKVIESCKQYKLYSISTVWEGTIND